MKMPPKIEQSTVCPEFLKNSNFSPKSFENMGETRNVETSSSTPNVGLLSGQDVSIDEYTVENNTNIEIDPDDYDDSNIELI